MRRLVPASWFRFGATLSWLLVLATGAASRADTGSSSSSSPFSAEAVRAAYLVNFIRFTEWPAGSLPPAAPFMVGVAGSRELEDELIRLADRQLVRERRLRIVRVKTPHDLDACHAVFFDPGMEPGEEPVLTAAEILPLLRFRPVLTISESPEFLAQGGMINLYRERGSVRFEIAPDTVRSAGLVLSSRLLALARIVRPDSPPAPPRPPASLVSPPAATEPSASTPPVAPEAATPSASSPAPESSAPSSPPEPAVPPPDAP